MVRHPAWAKSLWHRPHAASSSRAILPTLRAPCRVVVPDLRLDLASADQIMRILLDPPAEVAGEEPRLHFEQAPHRHPVAEDRMRDFLVEAALVGGDEGPLGVRLEIHRRTGGD